MDIGIRKLKIENQSTKVNLIKNKTKNTNLMLVSLIGSSFIKLYFFIALSHS
jgi:hypothetical protein